MKTENVGKEDAGNIPLIKLIFEVNLRLFSNRPRKKVLFVLRDFSPKEFNADDIKYKLTEIINEIW